MVVVKSKYYVTICPPLSLETRDFQRQVSSRVISEVGTECCLSFHAPVVSNGSAGLKGGPGGSLTPWWCGRETVFNIFGIA